MSRQHIHSQSHFWSEKIFGLSRRRPAESVITFKGLQRTQGVNFTDPSGAVCASICFVPEFNRATSPVFIRLLTYFGVNMCQKGRWL